MSTFRFSVIVAIVMIFSGLGAYGVMHPEVWKTFDYETASPAERSKYLNGKAKRLKGTFKPNFLSKNTFAGSSGNTIQLTYNTGMGSLTCGKEIDCKVRQCQKFLRSSISAKDIQIRLKYRDNSGRQIGSQTLRRDRCKSIVNIWDAGAERRKKAKAKKREARCSDDNIGMKPIDCRF